MNFIIGVDCEGPACVVGQRGRLLAQSRNYDFARAQATREADAAARALFDAGAASVIVWDNHGTGANLCFDQLDPRCRIALGAGFAHRWGELDDGVAGVLMIGYHAMEGTPGAVLAHTYSPRAFAWVKVNGRPVGEIAIDAAVAGERGVPVLLVASDDHGCDEARRFLPWIETVATKRGLGWNLALSEHPARAAEHVYEATARAVARIDQMKPFAFSCPIALEIRFKKTAQALNARLRRRGWRLTGLRTVRRTLEKMTDYF